jgi:NAD(P)H-dependent FMN reductase
MRVITLSGSFRKQSSNALLLSAVGLLAPPGVDVVMYDGLHALPHFDPDIEETALPPSASDLRQEVARADGMVIASPEYAHGVAGSFKNALDWLVGSTQFAGMPVAILNASPTARHAHEQLIEILTTMSANVVRDACLRVPVTRADGDARRIVADPARAALIRQAISALTDTIRRSPWR